jgi:transposase-like protein
MSRYEHEQEIRRLNAGADEKAVQLQSTITALRGQLEESTAQIAIQKQAVMAIAASEIDELKATCQALREELDQALGIARRGT